MWVNCDARTTCTNMDNIKLVPLELITSNRVTLRRQEMHFLSPRARALNPLDQTGVTRFDLLINLIFSYISVLVHVSIFL